MPALRRCRLPVARRGRRAQRAAMPSTGLGASLRPLLRACSFCASRLPHVMGTKRAGGKNTSSGSTLGPQALSPICCFCGLLGRRIYVASASIQPGSTRLSGHPRSTRPVESSHKPRGSHEIGGQEVRFRREWTTGRPVDDSYLLRHSFSTRVPRSNRT